MKIRLPVKFVKWRISVIFWLISTLAGAQTAGDSVAPEIKMYLEAGTLIDSAKYDAAVTVLKKLLKKKPDYFEAWNRSAFAKIKLEDYKGALKDLEKALKIAPVNYESVKMKGIAHFHLSEYPKSKSMLDTANFIAQEELIDDVELIYYRARLMYEGKNFKAALDEADRALDLKPRYIEAILLKGEARFAMKQYKHAVKDLTEAIDLMTATTTIYRAYELRAKAGFESGDFKSAVRDWSVFLEGHPKSEEALISRAAARININDHSAAIADLDEAIKLNGKNAVSYCYRGVAKGGNKMFEEAMKDLDYSIKLKFDYPVAYVNRAAIKMALRNKRGACEDLQKAESLGSETAIPLIERYCR